MHQDYEQAEEDEKQSEADLLSDAKSLLLTSASDSALCLFYYDRKNDEDLPLDLLERLMKSQTVTLDEVAAAFREKAKEFFEQETE